MQRQARGTRPSVYLQQVGSLREYARRSICGLVLGILVVLNCPLLVKAQQSSLRTIDIPGSIETKALGSTTLARS
jgi:hypothetical protein